MKYLVLLYLRVPSTEEEWLSSVENFESRWQYPNAIGAAYGKHVVIQKPSLPSPRYLPGGVQSIPFVFIGDDAFASKPNMMRLYL